MTNEAKSSNITQATRKLCKEKKQEKKSGVRRTPKLHYEFIESETGEQGLNAAFDILFREVFYRNVEKHD